MAVAPVTAVAGDSLANPALVDALSTGELCGALLTLPPVVGSYFGAPYDSRRASISFQLMTPGGSCYVSPLGSGTAGGFLLSDLYQSREWTSDMFGRLVFAEWYFWHTTGAPTVVLVQAVRCNRPATGCYADAISPAPTVLPQRTIPTPSVSTTALRTRYNQWPTNSVINPFRRK